MIQPEDISTTTSAVRSSVRKALAAALTVSLALSACGDDDEVGGGPVGASVGASSTVGENAPSGSAACPLAYPLQWQVVAEYEAELQYVDDITLCSDMTSENTLLINGSGVVWEVETTAGAQLQQLDSGFALDSFAEYAGTVNPTPLMYPDSRVLVEGPPSTVSWYIVPGLSMAWVLHERAFAEAQDLGEDVAINVLSRGSKARGALLTCLGALKDLTEDDPDQLQDLDAYGVLIQGLDTASEVLPCGRSLLAARNEALANNSRTTIAWADDFGRLADDVGHITRANSIANDAWRILQLGLLRGRG